MGLALMNLSLLYLHRTAFQSSEPFLVIITIGIHIGILTLINYENIFK